MVAEVAAEVAAAAVLPAQALAVAALESCQC